MYNWTNNFQPRYRVWLSPNYSSGLCTPFRRCGQIVILGFAITNDYYASPSRRLDLITPSVHVELHDAGDTYDTTGSNAAPLFTV